MICRLLRAPDGVLVALACRLVDGLAVRRPSVRRGRAQATRAAKRNALGRAERCTPAARRVILLHADYEKSVRLTDAMHTSVRGPWGGLGAPCTL